VTLAAASAVAMTLWTATGPAAGVRVYQSPPSGTAGDQARAYALGLLAKLRLPAKARQVQWPAQLRRLPQPVLPYWPTDAVTAQALYQAGASMGSVYWFLTRHVPAGMQPRWPGNVGNGTDRYVFDVPAHLPREIAHANLEVVIIPHGSGSLMRAEVQVVWYPPRSAAEDIHPSRYRSVTVTVPKPSDASGDTVTRTFTSRAVITQLAALLNQLPGMLPTAFNCPAMRVGARPPPSPYRLVFTPRSRQWPTIAAAPVGCFQGGIVVGKHKQPPLDFSRDKIMPVMLSLTGQQAK